MSAPPRGGGAQAERRLAGQSLRGSFAWGSAPGHATLVYAGTTVPVTAGARLDFTIGAHYFAGVCKSDSLVQSSGGTLRTLEFEDLRYFLTFDWVFGSFNQPDVRLVNGARVKRYWHIYPADWDLQRRTFTTRPLMGWEILRLAFRAPTVFTDWEYDLTSNGLWPAGLLNAPVYEVDANGGLRLDALLNLICEKTGLVFTHDPRPMVDYRLVFTRKGFGLLPLPFPKNADARRQGLSLTENASCLCVLGERNLYQRLNVPMVKDWAAAWEQFIDVELLAKDIFDNETDPVSGHRYNAFPSDADQWFGYGAAKVRALEVTVAQYIALRGARPGNLDSGTFADGRKFGGRWRMDMPAALYLQTIVFRAFRPAGTSFLNATGGAVPLDSAPIADALLCRVYLDYATGNMTADPAQPVDGNGVLAVQGYQAGADLFRLAQPDRVSTGFFSAASRGWGAVSFQLDDSGEGIRFVIASAPVFVCDNLLVSVNGYNVLNAGYTLQTPVVTAGLVFEAERYQYWKMGGTGPVGNGSAAPYLRDPAQPLPGRARVEPVSSLQRELLVDDNNPAAFTEIPYADNLYAADKADLVATTLLLLQQSYLLGGYNLKWDPKLPLDRFGTPLAVGSSCIDRVEISYGPDGVTEVVDFTCERARDHFEPERELDRRTIQASLFPGQAELRQAAADQKRFNAGLRQMGANELALFQKLLRGEVDDNLQHLRFVPGSTLPATLPVGSVLVRGAGGAGATGNVTVLAPAAVVAAPTNVFAGVTVRHNEPTGGTLPVRSTGDGYARVKGPVAANDGLGLSPDGGTDFATNGAYLVKGGSGAAAAVALELIADATVKLIKVRLQGASPGGDPGGNWNYRGFWSATPTSPYMTYDVVQLGVGTAAGIYISTTDNNTNSPDTGIGWVQTSSSAGTWL